MADDDGRPASFFLGPCRAEAYAGENEDIDAIDVLLLPQEQPPAMAQALGEAEPAASGPLVQVEQLGQDDLQHCLRQREWDRALDILTLMVLEGKAENGAVSIEVDSRDITRGHPELVILLRGHAYFNMRRQSDTGRAESYYRNHIRGVYPDGSASIGNIFVEKLLAELKAAAQDDGLPSEDHTFGNETRTDQWVNDYLKVYFPGFRHEVEEEYTRVGLFGERKKGSGVVRCLACHKEFRGYNQSKLKHHLLRNPRGRQVLCEASTNYIKGLISENTEATALPLPDVQGPPLSPQDDNGLPPPPDVQQPSREDNNAALPPPPSDVQGPSLPPDDDGDLPPPPDDHGPAPSRSATDRDDNGSGSGDHNAQAH